MKTSKIAALAFALFTAWAGSASAAAIDYTLTIPLVDISATDLTPTSLLRGTLSYDDDAMSGSGTFTLSGAGESVSDSFSGFAFLLPTGPAATGVLFDGDSATGSRLHFNILAGLDANGFVSSPVSFCTAGCAIFKSVGATMSPAGLSPISAPDNGSLPGGIVSPVTLPPSASLFGGALLGLGSIGAGRRLALRARAVKRRRR